MELTDLLLKDNNMQLAVDIAEAKDKARIKIQHLFWKELESKLNSLNYRANERNKYSEKTISRYYKTTAPQVYGLTLDLDVQPIEDESIKFEILVYGNRIYFSFLTENGDRGRDAKFDELASTLEEQLKFTSRKDWFLGSKYREEHPRTDFLHLNGLVDKEERQELVNSIALEVDSIIKDYNKIAKSLNGSKA